jgi:flagellar biogenesis protein FliO
MEKKLETRNSSSEGSMAKRIVVVLFSLVEIVLGFRFVFKLMGANPDNVFVKGLYDLTHLFVGVFEGIFAKIVVSDAAVKAVFEPATLIAIIVVGLIAWGVMKLMSQNTVSEVKKTETVVENPEQPK